MPWQSPSLEVARPQGESRLAAAPKARARAVVVSLPKLKWAHRHEPRLACLRFPPNIALRSTIWASVIRKIAILISLRRWLTPRHSLRASLFLSDSHLPPPRRNPESVMTRAPARDPISLCDCRYTDRMALYLLLCCQPPLGRSKVSLVNLNHPPNVTMRPQRWMFLRRTCRKRWSAYWLTRAHDTTLWLPR